jgi:hypothetical protein
MPKKKGGSMIVAVYKSKCWSLYMSEMVASIEEEMKKKKREGGNGGRNAAIYHISKFHSDNNH